MIAGFLVQPTGNFNNYKKDCLLFTLAIMNN